MADNQIEITYFDGAKVEIKGQDKSKEYIVSFYDNAEYGHLEYEAKLHAGEWASPNKKYYVPWHIVVLCDGEVVADDTLNLEGKTVLILCNSKSLGDNIAWFPYVEEFRKFHSCNVIAHSFWPNLLERAYPEITFTKSPAMSKELIDRCSAMYVLGAYDKEMLHRNKNPWQTIPLEQIASDYLGFEYKPIQPRICYAIDNPLKAANRNVGKYVCFSEYSTWKAKMWLYPNGWQNVVTQLRKAGYDVVSISKEPTRINGVIPFNNKPIEQVLSVLREAECFIGVSSGLMVCSWALGVKNIMISGSTEPYPKTEIPTNVRIINREVCHACFYDISLKLDRGDWSYCPRSNDFECTKKIAPSVVWKAVQYLLGVPEEVEKVQRAMEARGIVVDGALATTASQGSPQVETLPTNEDDYRPPREKILHIAPHCSTGGGPQYLVKMVADTKAVGKDVEVMEYRNISDLYTVQRAQLQAMVPYTILPEDEKGKLEQIKAAVARFKPDVIHLHDFAERFLHQEVADWLFSEGRREHGFKVVETTHAIPVQDKCYLPDGIVFVCDYQKERFNGHLNIPIKVAEYTVPDRVRPPRDVALAGLGLDKSKVHILQVGLFATWKNQAQTVAIAKLMKERGLTDYHFHFIGNTADNFREYWEPLLKEMEALDNCTLWGERDDTDRFYAAMDMLFFPSTQEVFPIVIKEALSWHMPALLRLLPSYVKVYSENAMVTPIDDDNEQVIKAIQDRRRAQASEVEITPFAKTVCDLYEAV